ncbi:MAG: hypothetical protein CVV42_14685 [Candidatus Riflebacteria bacterium HGW-Riflebacteria-2]|jgi:hypothetical protein|nr:MAG: hypothetical protein CVV42_14685 [Candidatus Riflebacteria bacterium HGW-Riflebacteria-2]
MKNIKTILLFITLLASSALFAGLAIPGEGNPMLASSKIEINNTDGYTVEKLSDNEGVRIKVRTPEGKDFWISEVLGDHEKKFMFNGESSNLLVADINADAKPEIITAVAFPPHNGALYIFTLNAEQNGFTPIAFNNQQTKDAKSFLTADIFQEDGQDLAFIDNRVRALGMHYPENEEAEPVASFFYYKLTGNTFAYDSCEAVPVEN